MGFLLYALSHLALSAEPHALTLAELSTVLGKYRSISVLRVNFTQTKILKDMDLKLVSHGKLTVVRPAKVIWEIKDPSPLTVTFDQSDLQIQSGTGSTQKTEHYQIRSGQQGFSALKALSAWLNVDVDALYKDYTILSTDNNQYLFKPKQKGIPFESILAKVGSSGHLEGLTLNELSGDQLELRFDNPEITHR